MGQVLQGGAGQAPARQAAVAAGIPIEVPADTINKVCASSIRAVEIADSMIRAGDVDVVVTGGMESMSNAPYILKQARFGYRLGDGDAHRPDDRTTGLPRASTTGTWSSRRRSCPASSGSRARIRTAWALRSHERAAAAQDEGRFADEIVAVGEVTADESIRRDTTYEKLAVAQAGVRPGGDDHRRQRAGRERRRLAASSSAREEFAKKRGLEPLAVDRRAGLRRRRLRVSRAHAGEGGRAWRSSAPGKKIADVKRVEINEAFASVASNSTRMLGADEEIVNVNGGAVALGHPIGACGGRILGTMVHDLRRNGGGLGLAAICSGGGQGDALLVEV